MRGKRYYKIRFRLLEPLSVGNGDNRYSDHDILRNCLGDPFIPGTSLCGVYRSCLDKETAERFFGFVRKVDQKNKKHKTLKSSVKVYDAVLEKSCVTSVRDSVGLDEYKTAKDGTKFDFELVEPGAVFVTYLEQDFSNKDEKDDIGETIIDAYEAGRIVLGHKAMRGYGSVALENVWKKEFNLGEEKEIDVWLNFDMYAQDAFGEGDVYQPAHQEEPGFAPRMACIELDLVQCGGISIRRYTTEVEKGKNSKQGAPDYVQMFYLTDDDEIPYIPGTSWAGAFRQRIFEFLPEKDRDNIIEKYFGVVKKKEKSKKTIKKKSKIRFAESRIEGAFSKTITRTAIDRFTGGAAEGALYTEKSFFGGKTLLKISFPVDSGEQGVCWNRAVAAAVTDLDEGYLALGGLTAVGRGLFRVEACRLNGKEIYEAKETALDGETPKLYRILERKLSRLCKENVVGEVAQNE